MTEELILSAVSRRLESDVLSADFQWSILWAAANSYRHDTVLRPFPPMFLIQNDSEDRPLSNVAENRNYEELTRLMSLMPSFVRSKHNELLSALVKLKLLDLLHWTLYSKSYSLKSCDSTVFSEITTLTGQCVSVPPPNHIFAVLYSDEYDQRFSTLRADRSVIHAYHGSRLENFHSILSFGLQGHMNKNAVFGEGTYLSSELSVCLHYSPTGTGWDKSLIGCRLSCVAVCEIIDDPSVRCKIHDKTRPPSSTRPDGGLSRTNSRARIAGSIGGDVPEKYYVVQNNEMIRVKYILVYTTKESPPHRQSVSWLHQHCFMLVVLLYVLLLVTLGVFKSPAIRAVMRW